MMAGTTMLQLGMDDLDWATGLLTDAFLDAAPATHLFQGPKRKLQTTCFMRCSGIQHNDD